MSIETKSYLLETPEALANERARLLEQSRILFDLERPVLRDYLGRGNQQLRILDLGCGNCAYLSCLLAEFTGSVGMGFEINQDLIAQAREINESIEICRGNLLDETALGEAIAGKFPDVINLRFVLQHLSEAGRKLVLQTIRKNKSAETKVIISEPDDAKVSLSIGNPVVEELISRTVLVQAERGGDRTVAGKMENELQKAGFANIHKTEYILSNKTVGMNGILKVIWPMWRSYRVGEDKSALDEKVQMAHDWLVSQSSNEAFEIRFPLYIFCAS